MWGRQEVLLLALACPLLLGWADGQGYGNLDDDAEAFNGQPQAAQQPDTPLPQYESVEQGQPGNPPQPQQQYPQGNSAGQSPNSPNLWWQGQNAFQRPPGHPGVEMLDPSKSPQGQAPAPAPPQSGYDRPGSYSPQGGGSGWGAPMKQQQQPSQQYQNAPKEQYNNPAPQAPAPQQYRPSGGGQAQPQYNNPVPPPQSYNPPPQQPPQSYNPPPQQPPQSYNPPPQSAYNPPPAPQSQPQGGWNAPSSQPAAPGCELRNKADCHNRRNGGGSPPLPPQNYQPPPINPEPYPEEPPYTPVQQQQAVPPPNLGYQPPPQQQPNNYYPAPSTNPYPAEPPPPQPQQPQPQANPQPQRPPTQPQPQPQRPPTQPQPRPQPYQPPQAPRPRPVPQQQQQQPEEAPVPYPGCPAAMLCVQDEYCNMIGLIEENPLQLSAAERINRVALMQCSEPVTGIVGVCCRDPNYTDPWPDMNGMMKKDGGHHQHHPKPQGQKSPNFQPQPPPQGNHLVSGGGANPYSDILKINGKNRAARAKNLFGVASSSSPSQSESKQTIQVLEPCLSDELCISMSQCHSLNPEFMAKTGLNPKTKQSFGQGNLTEPIKVKQCKYERSGISYLCCKKPRVFPTTPPPRFFLSFPKTYSPFSTTRVAATPTTTTAAPPVTRAFSSSTAPTPTYKPFHLPSTTKSSLITGVGLRFHSGLHSQKQLELNSKKVNPYQENEKPIILLTSPFTVGPTLSPFQGTTSPFKPTSFRFTPTTSKTSTSTRVPPPLPFTNEVTESAIPTQTAPATAKVIGTTKPFFSAPTTTTTTTSSPSPSTNGTTTTTTEPTPTTTEGKVDVEKIPNPVPLYKELKENPPVGFIFKGEDLFIPEVQIPSQNFLLPENDFEERTFPPEEGEEENLPPSTQPTVEDTTTTYSLSDEPSNNSASEKER